MAPGISSIAERLAKRVALTGGEARFLDILSADAVRFARGEAVQLAGEPADRAFVLKSGWAMTFTDLIDGSRQIRRLHFPGDLLAVPSVAMRRHVETIEAVTDVTVAPFPKTALARLFQEHPRLAAILFMFAQEERITYGDRLAALGRLSARARIAFLLMDVLTRLRAVDGSDISTYEMHLTRAQMGELTGMTAVHASRMWSRLIAERLIAWDGIFVTIRDEARLIRLSDFSNRSADLDFAWLPPRQRSEADAPALRLPG